MTPVLWIAALCLGSDPVAPQDARTTPAAPGEATELEEVVVYGRRGATTLTPDFELGADQIDALGAWDIGEVVARVGESLGGDQPPVVIINGRRILDPRNFTGFPPDAVSRVEVLPPEAAALYGEDPSRRVLNVVLVPAFHSRDGLARAWAPTAGGASGLSLDARQSSIQDDDTRQYGLQVSRDTALWSDERPDYRTDLPPRDAFTLRPEARTVTANLAATGALGEWTTSLNAAASQRTERLTTRLADASVPIRQTARSLSLNGGLGGEIGGWTLRAGLDGVLGESRQSGSSEVRARNLSIAGNVVADRPLVTLPAGPATLNLAGRWSRFGSDVETEGAGSVDRSTEALDLKAGLSIPLMRSARRGRGAAIGRWGDASLTLGGRLRRTDDADPQGGLNGAFSWTPVRKVRFSGQWAVSTDSPSDSQRFDPAFYGPARTVFDFQTGEAVEIVPLLGGNPDLRSEKQERLALSAALGPFTEWRVQGNLNWTKTEATNGIGALPALSPEAEAAFPERFIRDGSGRLTGIDQRPINLASVRGETLAWGLNMSLPLGARASGDAIQLGVTHTWRLSDALVIREGYPVLDRLAGDGGGTSRHQIGLRLDGRIGRWGVNADARWRGGARVRRDMGRDGPEDLRLEPLATADLKISYRLGARRAGDAGEPADRDPGVRIELEIVNLFDARPGATLGDVRPAPGYGPDDQDPLGRVARIALSRRF